MLARKVLHASMILSGGRFLIRSLDLIAALVIARFLTPADFGLVTLAMATLMILRGVTELPVAEALIRSEELTREDIDTAFTLSCLRSVAVALLLCVSAWPMAAIYDDPRLGELLLVCSLATIVHGLRSPELVRFGRSVNYLPDMILDTAAKTAAFVVSIAVAYSTGSFWALAIVLIAPPLVSTPLSYFFAPYRPRFSLASTGAILGFAGRVTLLRLLGTARAEADRFLVGGILGTAPLGSFALGRSIVTTATWAIGGPLVQAMFSGFSKLQHDRGLMRSAYLRGQAVLVASIMPLGVGLSVLAEPMVALVLGERWAAAAPIVQVLAPVGALATMTMPVHAVVLALGRPQRLIARDAIMLALSLPAVAIGASAFGLMGVAYALLLSGIVHTLLNLRIVQREIGATVGRQLLNCWRSALSLICMVSFMLMLASGQETLASSPRMQVAHLGMQAVAGGLAYLGAHAVLWLLAGKPRGPESFAGETLGALLQRGLRSRRQPEGSG